MGSRFAFFFLGGGVLSASLHDFGRTVGVHDQYFIHNGNNKNCPLDSVVKTL